MSIILETILVFIIFSKFSVSDVDVHQKDGHSLELQQRRSSPLNYETSLYDTRESPESKYGKFIPPVQKSNERQIKLSDQSDMLRTLFLNLSRDYNERHQWNYLDTDGKDTNNANTYETSSQLDRYTEELCEIPAWIHKIQRLNKTKTLTNGKIYKITKVVKTRKCRRQRRSKSETIQRRTLNINPGTTAMIPIPWMTKKQEGNEKSYREFEDEYPLPKAQGNEKIQTVNDFVNNVGPGIYNPNKLKTALNLFTIVKFDNGECYFNGLKGTCLHQIECQAKGGKPIGTCAQGFGVCCYVERTCGEQTRENCTYFVNEGFPRPSTSAPRVCTLVVQKANPDVEQLRLEFIVFELRGPNNGTCLTDRFTVTGHNINHVVPDICGINNEQHVYIDIDESNGPYTFNVVTMGEDFPRTFQIKITQIKKNDELLAPKNCLQYHTEPIGVIQTFNYQYNDLGNLPQAIPGYFNNLNYAICMKKVVGFCSITYENEERDSTNESPAFQMQNTDHDGEKLLPPKQGGAEVFDCPDDYIIVNGVRLCGEKLNDATIDADYTKNYPVTDFSNGPFILQVRTNNAVNGRGFYLRYRQNPCLQ